MTMLDADSTNYNKVIWSGRPSQLVYLFEYILFGLSCWLIFPIFFGLWRWLEVNSINYEITTERFRRTSGILSRRVVELELYRIKNTVLDQPFGLRIFGLASILIESSDVTRRRWIIAGIPLQVAAPLREELRGHTERLRGQKQVREVDVR